MKIHKAGCAYLKYALELIKDENKHGQERNGGAWLGADRSGMVGRGMVRSGGVRRGKAGKARF